MSYSTTASWSPNSLQLRLALSHSCRSVSFAIPVRSRRRRMNHHPRLLCCASRNGVGRKRLQNGSSWIAADSAGANFAGWSDSDDSEKSIEPQTNTWIRGAVGAGVAGVVLVAGLTIASLSISKHSVSRSIKPMEPLTTEQETLLDSNKEDLKLEDEEESRNLKEGVIDLNIRKGIDKDIASSSESNNVSNENRLDAMNETPLTNDVQNTSSGGDFHNNHLFEEDLSNESAFDDTSVGSDVIPASPKFPSNETRDDESFVASDLRYADRSLDSISPKSTSAVEMVVVNVSSNNFPNSGSVDAGKQDRLFELKVDQDSNLSLDSSSSIAPEPSEPDAVVYLVHSELDATLETHLSKDLEVGISYAKKESTGLGETPQVSTEKSELTPELHSVNEGGSLPKNPASGSAYPSRNESDINGNNKMDGLKSYIESSAPENSFSSVGIPAPSIVSTALQINPGKVLVPAVVDQVQGQALAALQVLKVIEADVQASSLCSRREYARWLVSASNTLSRNTTSKVYPAMYIENVTELAFDDITPKDPDFASIQGLAEAGLISSKLSRRDLLPSLSEDEEGSFYFFPDSALSRQDLVSWKMTLEKRQLPEANRKILYENSGFIDVDKINSEAWPALVADLAAGEQGIIALSFGCTRLFQPNKPVTKAQAAIALATGEASDIVNEELTRIEAESMAENAVATHNALVAQVEKDINANFEKELSMEREKIDAVEKLAEEATRELEKLRAQREDDSIALMKERVAIDSEMEVLSRLRREVEEQLQSLISNKVEISYEKERVSKLLQEAENENQEITRLQYELEVERKALSMARSWAEDEAKRAREEAKALEEARERWERRGIKVVVDNDLREESSSGATWVNAGKPFSVKETVNRAENLVEKLKAMANNVKGRSKEVIDIIILKVLGIVSMLKEWGCKSSRRANEVKENTMLKARESMREWQQSTTGLNSVVKEGAKRLATDCSRGVEKITQKFKV